MIHLSFLLETELCVGHVHPGKCYQHDDDVDNDNHGHDGHVHPEKYHQHDAQHDYHDAKLDLYDKLDVKLDLNDGPDDNEVSLGDDDYRTW